LPAVCYFEQRRLTQEELHCGVSSHMRDCASILKDQALCLARSLKERSSSDRATSEFDEHSEFLFVCASTNLQFGIENDYSFPVTFIHFPLARLILTQFIYLKRCIAWELKFFWPNCRAPREKGIFCRATPIIKTLEDIDCLMNSWASGHRIVSQLSRLEHQISLKESNLHSQWKTLNQQILERKGWKNEEKYYDISDRRNGPNGPNGPNRAEEFCPFSATQAHICKSHPPWACCGAPGECRFVFECGEIRFCREAIFGLNSEEASSLPKNDSLDEMNEAIMLALSDEHFSSARHMADRPQDMRSKKHSISPVCRFSAFHTQTSGIFIGFLTSSPTVRRQVKSSRIEFSIGYNGDTCSILILTSESWFMVHGSWFMVHGSWFCLSTDQIRSDQIRSWNEIK
jgi:hypothetical protein